MNVREIKFRAWEEESKQMITEPEFIQVCTEKSYAVFVESWGEWATKGFVLMQFTGLKDKNGREIYEGDILRCENEQRPGVVYWGNCGFRVNEGTGIPLSDVLTDDFIEVIGNIYENPEALKEGGGR